MAAAASCRALVRAGLPVVLLLAALSGRTVHANDEVRSEMRWTQAKLKGGRDIAVGETVIVDWHPLFIPCTETPSKCTGGCHQKTVSPTARREALTKTASGLEYLDQKVGTGPLVEQGDSAKVLRAFDPEIVSAGIPT